MSISFTQANKKTVERSSDMKKSSAHKNAYLIVKRILDVLVAAIGLIVMFLPMVIIAMLIKIESPGPAIYIHNRIGKNGKNLPLLKFRSMYADADNMIENFTPEQKAEWEENFKLENDPRITKLGMFLRKSSIDELPQLINILKGEMSLVGPRPERPELAAEIEAEIPEFAYRLKVKAGLTGYAQIYGKYNTTAYDKVKLDLTYIRNYNYFLDWKMILMTPKILLMKESTEGLKDDEELLALQELAAAKMNLEVDAKTGMVKVGKGLYKED